MAEQSKPDSKTTEFIPPPILSLVCSSKTPQTSCTYDIYKLRQSSGYQSVLATEGAAHLGGTEVAVCLVGEGRVLAEGDRHQATLGVDHRLLYSCHNLQEPIELRVKEELYFHEGACVPSASI